MIVIFQKKNGNTPLHLATKKGKINFISALLRHGANPNLCNKLFNQTPFHIAIIEKLSKDIITLFKNFDADLYIINFFIIIIINYTIIFTYFIFNN